MAKLVAGAFVFLLSATLLGCGLQEQVLETYQDDVCIGTVVLGADSAFVAEFRNLNQRGNPQSVGVSRWRYQRSFATPDSARQFLAEVRFAYHEWLREARANRQPQTTASPDTGAASYGLGSALRNSQTR